MRIIATILVMSLCARVSAQRLRFTDQGNQWVTIGSYGIVGTTTLRTMNYGADTTLYGTTYKRISNADLFFVREDTIANKVYYRSFNSLDTSENILYDFNLKIGDTIRPLGARYGVLDSVYNVDSVWINLRKYKIFSMTPSKKTGGIPYTVIEGIGCTNGPTFPVSNNGCVEFQQSLVCFSRSGYYPAVNAAINYCGRYPYRSNFVNSVGCALGTYNISKEEATFTILPNPANDYIEITSTGKLEPNTFFSVYDAGGRCVTHTMGISQNTTTINTSLLNDGLFMVIIQNNNGIIKKEKVIVQH
jgi:hypothetical protein